MQTVFHIQEKPPPPTKKQKRQRISLSCQSCKRRKIKCDRSSPCNNCIKYKQECIYSDPVWNQKENSSGSFSVSRLSQITPQESPKITTPEDVQSQLSLLKEKIDEIESNLKPIKNNSVNYNDLNNPTYIGINPYLDDNEVINFYHGYQSVHVHDVIRRTNYGPFSWLSLLKKDPALLQQWNYLQNYRDDYKKKMVSTNRDECKANDTDEHFREKAIDRDGYNDLRLYKTKLSDIRTKLNCKIDCTKINKHGMILGLTMYEGKIDQELKLIEKIKITLPKQRIIWLLINKFFAELYPFMPILDEVSFKTEMERILGVEDYKDEPPQVVIEKRLDFAYLGIMLIIIRLSYLALFSNKNENNQQNFESNNEELKYLLNNPININLIDMAQLCLEQFEIYRKTNLIVLQCTFLLRLYRMFAPEDGDGADGGDSQTFNGMLIQMSYNLGLNREPSQDLKIDNIIRKTWFFLIICDLIQGYQFGNPLNIDEKYYDTKLPFYLHGNENILNIEMEKYVIGTFAYFEKYHYKLLHLLNTTLDIKKLVKISELTQLINDFEVFLNDNFGMLKFILIPYDSTIYKYSFIKIMKCKNYINMKMFLNNIFIHLFLHYEKKSTNFAFFYLKKILSNLCGEFVVSIHQLISDNIINFGGSIADLILNPTIQNMIHRISQINFAILIRINSSIYKMRNSHLHDYNLSNDDEYRLKFAKLSKISQLFIKIIEICINAMSRLSRRYYYAWRVSKAHTFILKNCLSKGLYESNKSSLIEFLDLSNDQFNEILQIVESSIKQTKEYSQVLTSNEDENFINDLEIDQLWMQLAQYNNENITNNKSNNSSNEFNAQNNLDNLIKDLNEMNQDQLNTNLLNDDLDQYFFNMDQMLDKKFK
ncbi:unnamed protein product [Candida verbasci]|uniref:Zn(2)-C6 fungal-type domain-containing protein n=1 Tax=Candida verbasci TaxID=1227364 RepID=A0A9W4TZS2_9ASCO|nr:unnamed protein product [Candida verbasci]